VRTFIALLLLALPANVHAQTVAIRSTGGFLGYLDGFPEFPGWPGETFEGNPDLIPNPPAPSGPARPVPYGGLIGVATYLKSHPADAAVLLISGNNHPRQIAALRDPTLRNDAHAIPAAVSHWFWKPMIDLKPQAVGIGTDDIHRWLAQMRPEHLSTWVKDAITAGLPLVASNVIVRLIDTHLNVVRNDDHHVTLDVAEGESLDMIDSLIVRHPCAVNSSLRSSSFRFDSGPVVAVKTLTPAEQRAEHDSTANKARRAVLGNVCRTTIEFGQRLRPGRSYLLASSLTGPAFRFRLTTHHVLTPHGAWDGLPVVGARPAGVPMAIMAF
jgi:hypothetical protein